MNTRILVILTLLALHGCTTVEDPFLEGMTGSIPVSSENRELPVHLASASLAGVGGMPIGLRQTSTDGAVREVLVWANTTTIPGENTLTISTFVASGSKRLTAPDRSEIGRALRREFPGVAMSIDPGVRQNAYGAYGTATGKLGEKGGCVYAWQSVSRDIELGRDKAAEVHLRYCHAAIGPDRLADLLSGLSMNKTRSITSLPSAAYGYADPAPETQANSGVTNHDTHIEEPAEPVHVSGKSRRDEPTMTGTVARIPMPN
ncbi:cellulose biosynthesis protein BcsN (plasmid) [Rhizobium rosettiformans]|uniref:Cellulose biosynthesis protein BcsN n=1 Tax=Rhizobium rosettiformans TaxID=1368430 RepID=A0ABX7F4Q7_9HYPH|nr:cellulose biosynthesis protein BcsN [Rhizobium rosettiformans]QRF54366.1 cellulose biosynthesis protein BcsN [Rhizobium rosettiformans]